MTQSGRSETWENVVLRKQVSFLLLIVLSTVPAFAGWWTNYEDETWCHRLEEYKYCLPANFRLERLEGAHLEFVDRSDDYTSVFAKYLGNDTLEELLADLPIPTDLLYLDSDTYVNGLRLIRYLPNENKKQNHNLMIVFVIFPDESVVQIAGTDSSLTNSAINSFIEPVPIR